MVVIFRAKKTTGLLFFTFQVDSKEAFWAWINEVFIPGIYGTRGTMISHLWLLRVTLKAERLSWWECRDSSRSESRKVNNAI